MHDVEPTLLELKARCRVMVIKGGEGGTWCGATRIDAVEAAFG